MNKTHQMVIIWIVCLLLAGCGVQAVPAGPAMPGEDSQPGLSQPAPQTPQEPGQLEPGTSVGEEASSHQTPLEPLPQQAQDPFEEELEAIYWRMEDSPEPEEVIRTYLELQYLGYAYLEPVDLGLVLDLEEELMQNLQVWQELLLQRRRLLAETDLCYVEQERFDFQITFIPPEELTDGRLEQWQNYDFGPRAEEAVYHFVVTGEPGKAYPPLMALNAQHTVRLRREEDGWKITFHYFPGARRMFYSNYLNLREDEELLQELIDELNWDDNHTTESPRSNSTPYRGMFAARYAKQFAETPNPDFYHVGDWNGNCMNFVSQSILHGFGEGVIPDASLIRFMTAEWFSGGGGGTLAWENVDYFWAYATEPGPLRCQVLQSAGGLRAGDVIQIRNRYLREGENPNDYSHSLMVVDPDTMMLAQNSPANLVYFSDLVEVHKRYVRPLYMD